MPDNTFWDIQANRALHTPNLSPAQVREIEDWVHANKKAEERRVQAMVAESSKANKAMETRLKDEVKDALFGLQATVKEARSHRIEYPELSAEIDNRRKVLASAEARLQSLENSVQRSQEIIDDPHAYMESLYRRFPAIDKRQHLVEGVLDKS
jgi:hypothetical protein